MKPGSGTGYRPWCSAGQPNYGKRNYRETTRALLHFPILFLTLTFLSLLTRQLATSTLFRFSIVSPEPLIAKPRAGVGRATHHSFCSLHLGAFALSRRGEEALRSAVLGNRTPAHATLR
ncbi:hypothetical protein ACLKA6_007783 [Drosophila palustris]